MYQFLWAWRCWTAVACLNDICGVLAVQPSFDAVIAFRVPLIAFDSTPLAVEAASA
jgi:hypothetical protein